MLAIGKLENDEIAQRCLVGCTWLQVLGEQTGEADEAALAERLLCPEQRLVRPGIGLHHLPALIKGVGNPAPEKEAISGAILIGLGQLFIDDALKCAEAAHRCVCPHSSWISSFVAA